MKFCNLLLVSVLLFGSCFARNCHAEAMPTAVQPHEAASLYPLSSVRLLDSPFTVAVQANREYMLALEPDRLLAPFRTEAGLEPRKPIYGNWEAGGLGGQNAGHYLSALSGMIASGADRDGEFARRLDYMLAEMKLVQDANGDGYIGGVPGSREFWKVIASGDTRKVSARWVPWYNVHKTLAGLRDAYWVAEREPARDLLVKMGDWCIGVTLQLTDEQMQIMLGTEFGGMNEVLADVYAITGDEKYLQTAQRFFHHAVLDPLLKSQDKLTGLHANTQIPKIIGLERIASLTGNHDQDAAAKFFWDSVVQRRSVSFGGNSVSEHFNDPKNFRGMLEHREGPETCNTFNMLRLTEKLFASAPRAAYADYYERALFNHILASINPQHPGFVYFTPIRPGHYRVYSQPGVGMWCCVGTGIENPSKYGQFIYAKSTEGIYVNLFIASVLKDAQRGLTLRQETQFPDEARTKLTLKLTQSAKFAIYIRNPAWVADGQFVVTVNGKSVAETAKPSSYIKLEREWSDGDQIEVSLPMRTTVEELPDGSPWYAILHGPIVLASPMGTDRQNGLFAGDGRGDHIPGGPLISLDQVPVLLAKAEDLPSHVVPDAGAGPLHFRLRDVVEPASKEGLPLAPFFRLHESRYQMYWELTTKEGLTARHERLEAAERAKLARDKATLDSVAVGEQQSEVDHEFKGEGTDTGIFTDRRWRHGTMLQYTLNTRGKKPVELVVTYWGSDVGRKFDIFADDKILATQSLNNEQSGKFFEKRYEIPDDVLSAAKNDKVTVKFVATEGVAGGLFDLRLMLRNNE